MHAQENAETAGLKRCFSCNAEQRARDKFCRQCGISQRVEIASTAINSDWLSCETGRLPVATRYDSFSGALVSLVTMSMSARASAHSSSVFGNRWARRLASALVAFPLWLMIVLLSPLDAYVAARAIVKRA